jgi:ferredoxin
MKVKVDMELCRGYAICAGIAPSYFEMDPQGDLMLLQDEVADTDIEAIRESAMICPQQAIIVTED